MYCFLNSSFDYCSYLSLATEVNSLQRSTAFLPKRSPAPRARKEDSPEIEVVSEKKKPAPSTTFTSTNGTVSSRSKDSPATPSVPKRPLLSANHTSLLNILARPINMYPVAIAVRDRKELDVMVKSSLVKTQHDFIDWLFSLRLLKDRLICHKHRNSSTIRLGLFQMVSVRKVFFFFLLPGGIWN